MSSMLNVYRSLTSIGLVAAVVVSLTASHARAEPDVEQLLRHFDTIAFGSEIEGVDRARQTQKWVSPVRVSVSAMKGEMIAKPGGKRELKLSFVRPSESHVTMIRKHLTTLVKLTGLQSEESDAEKGKPANFFIKFVPRLAMGQPFVAKDVEPAILQKLARPGVCYFVTRAIRTGALFRAQIVVNADLPPDVIDACLLEEMTQALGLPNDSDVVMPSIFNRQSTQQALTDSDKILLRTLYDRRLPPGTPRVDALRIGRDVIAELLAGG